MGGFQKEREGEKEKERERGKKEGERERERLLEWGMGHMAGLFLFAAAYSIFCHHFNFAPVSHNVNFLMSCEVLGFCYSPPGAGPMQVW